MRTIVFVFLSYMLVVVAVKVNGTVESSKAASSTSCCQTLTLQEDFDLQVFISQPWYSQANTPPPEIAGVSGDQECISAVYTQLTDFCAGLNLLSLQCLTSLIYKYLNGFDIDVYNRASVGFGASDGTGGFLCGVQIDGPKLGVSPCFLPSWLVAGNFGQGNYWVVAYDEPQGYALIAGGQPDTPTTGGLCELPSSRGGFITLFTRAQNPPSSLIDTVKGIAEAKGLDVSGMETVDHAGCPEVTKRDFPRNYKFLSRERA